MLPLMNSAMSSSLPALPSSSSSTADMIWPGRAVAALERVVLDERPLHRVQLAVGREALDRRHLAALAGDGQRQAGEHAPAVDPDGAGAARALVAALLGARQVEVLAQRVEQAHAWFHDDRAHLVVDRHLDPGAGRRCGPGRVCAVPGGVRRHDVHAVLLKGSAAVSAHPRRPPIGIGSRPIAVGVRAARVGSAGAF